MTQISNRSAIFPVLQKLTQIYRHTFKTSRLRGLGIWRTLTRTSRLQGKGIWGIKKSWLFNFSNNILKNSSTYFQGFSHRQNLVPDTNSCTWNDNLFLGWFFSILKTSGSFKLKICLRSILLLQGCKEGVLCASAGFCVQAEIKRQYYKNAFQYTRQTKNYFLLTTLHSSFISSFPRQESGRYDPLYGLPPTVTP